MTLIISFSKAFLPKSPSISNLFKKNDKIYQIIHHQKKRTIFSHSRSDFSSSPFPLFTNLLLIKKNSSTNNKSIIPKSGIVEFLRGYVELATNINSITEQPPIGTTTTKEVKNEGTLSSDVANIITTENAKESGANEKVKNKKPPIVQNEKANAIFREGLKFYTDNYKPNTNIELVKGVYIFNELIHLFVELFICLLLLSLYGIQDFPTWLEGLGLKALIPKFKGKNWEEIIQMNMDNLKEFGIVSREIRKRLVMHFDMVKRAIVSIVENDPRFI